MKNTFKVTAFSLILLFSFNSSAMNPSQLLGGLNSRVVGKFVGKTIVGAVRFVLRAANILGGELNANQAALEERKQQIEELNIVSPELQEELQYIDMCLKTIAESKALAQRCADQSGQLAGLAGGMLQAQGLDIQARADALRQAADFNASLRAELASLNPQGGAAAAQQAAPAEEPRIQEVD